jgi:formylglycine-generating enzyme required for sulfatase activity
MTQLKAGKIRAASARATLLAGMIVALMAATAPGQPAAEVNVKATNPPAPASSPFAPTVPNQTPAPGPAPEGMVWIPGGEFSMGCVMPSEGVCTMATMNALNDALPVRRVYVDGFWMDTNDVTTEAEWEFAARGGLSGKTYAWGDELKPGGKWMANIYEGQFPVKDTGEDGFAGIAPVGQFPPNGYGLFDMAGNVWQWCSDWYRPDTYARLKLAGGDAVVRNPQGPAASYSPGDDQPQRVQRGGSFLCTDQYCTRYMMGTRGKGDIDTGSNHLGFRRVKAVETGTTEREKSAR